MVSVVETLIIGGGISGLACARRLCDAGRPFLLVTDRLGGRMHHSPDGTMNFGACYITADYRHIQRYVGRGNRFRLHEAWAQNNGALTSLFEWRNLRFVRPMLRLILRLRELRTVMQRFRRDAEHTAQSDLLPRYPLFQRYVRQSAGELIEELGLEQLHELYLKPSFLTTCFADPLQANAFFYLGVLFPLIVPTWVADFTRTYDLLTAGYRDRVAIDRVIDLARSASGPWEVRTAGGKVYRAANVVIAAPYHNAREFYPVPAPHRLCPATVTYVRGRRRPPFRGKRFILFPPEQTGLTLIWQQPGRNDQVFSLCPQPKLEGIYESAEVLGTVTWKTAIVLSGPTWAPLKLEANLYLVGDHNICGLEDSFITGLCAANHIIREVPFPARTDQSTW